jgi:hypothetical protein
MTSAITKLKQVAQVLKEVNPDFTIQRIKVYAVRSEAEPPHKLVLD